MDREKDEVTMPAPKGNKNAVGAKNPRAGKKGKAAIHSMPHHEWEAFKEAMKTAYGYPQSDEFCVKEWRRLSGEAARQWCLWHAKDHWQYDTPQDAIDASVYGVVRTAAEDLVLTVRSTSLPRGGQIVNVSPYTVSLRRKGAVCAETIIDDLGELAGLAGKWEVTSLLAGKWEVTK
jgi:hypothetical protein